MADMNGSVTNVLYTGYYYMTSAIAIKAKNNGNACPPYDTSDYLSLIWSLAAEQLGVLILFVMSRFFTDLQTFFLTGIASAVPLAVLLVPNLGLMADISLIFVSRSFQTSFNQALYIYIPQIFPSVCRGKGVGLVLGLGVLGAAIAPLTAGVLITEHLFIGKLVFLIFAFVNIVGSLMLPDISSKRLEDPMFVPKEEPPE